MATIVLALAVLGSPGDSASAVRPIPEESVHHLFPCDDGIAGHAADVCSANPGTPEAIGFAIDVGGRSIDRLFVNNNGNVSVSPPSSFSLLFPDRLTDVVFAPFWGDVDTRAPDGGVVSYGMGIVDDHAAFLVTWDRVGYFNRGSARRNTFQVVVIDRGDIAPGDADVEFNYDAIEWEMGDADGGVDGLGRSGAAVARAFLPGGGGRLLELPGSGVAGALLDTNLETGLATHGHGSPLPGRWVFRIRNGFVVECQDASTCDDGSSCTDDACALVPGDPFGGCEHAVLPDGVSCSSADSCSYDLVCDRGQCVGTPYICDDGNECTIDTCAPDTPPFNGCLLTPTPGPDGIPCEDYDACTLASACVQGGCSDVERVCTLRLDRSLSVSRTRRIRNAVVCEAGQDASCEGQLFAFTEETGQGEALSDPTRRPIRRKGRYKGSVIVNLRLNAAGLALIADQRKHDVLLLGTVIEPDGTRRTNQRLVRLRD